MEIKLCYLLVRRIPSALVTMHHTPLSALQTIATVEIFVFDSLGTLYNKQRHYLYRVQHLQFMAACVPPGEGTSCGGVASYAISHRLSRLMTVLSFFPLSSESLETIYSSVFQAWLGEFPAYSLSHHEHLAKVRKRKSRKLPLGDISVSLCLSIFQC